MSSRRRIQRIARRHGYAVALATASDGPGDLEEALSRADATVDATPSRWRTLFVVEYLRGYDAGLRRLR